MAFIVIGVLMLLLHFVGIGPTADWDPLTLKGFAKYSVPFLLALAWWAWADGTGMTKRREMEREVEKQKERRKRHIEAMGLGPDQRSSSFRRR